MGGRAEDMEGLAMKKKRWNRKFWIPTITEIVGIMLMSIGLGYEMAYRAEFGYVLITAGSVITALGGVLFAKFKPWLEEK